MIGISLSSFSLSHFYAPMEHWDLPMYVSHFVSESLVSTGFCLDRFHVFSFTIKLVLYQKAYNTPVLKLDWPCCVWYMDMSYWDISSFFHELFATPELKSMRSMMPTSHIKFSCRDIFHNLLVSIWMVLFCLEDWKNKWHMSFV